MNTNYLHITCIIQRCNAFICSTLRCNLIGGGKRQNAINNRANRAYFIHNTPTMFAHQAA